jgi:hypothetical protein
LASMPASCMRRIYSTCWGCLFTTAGSIPEQLICDPSRCGSYAGPYGCPAGRSRCTLRHHS